MQKVNLYISREAPHVRGIAAWLKPVEGGFTLSVLNGKWEDLKVADGVDANTIKEELTGTDSDTSDKLTLYGLKAYIDEQIESLG